MQHGNGSAYARFEETGPLEIRQLAGRLNDMRGQIHNMLQQRTAMLRSVSHDLRTPLTRLKLRVERSVPSKTADILIRDITSINEMIDETLDYLRSDNSAEKPRKADIPSLLTTICSDFTDIGFRVSYDGPARLAFRCRTRALSRAISNLVDNATKHGNNVAVKLCSLPDLSISIIVSDDGPGMPEHVLENALEPFFKGDEARTSSPRGGFGLGLSIARDIIERQGGKIELNPALPHGLHATVSLPML
jgi:signal transduction histidine kinase